MSHERVSVTGGVAATAKVGGRKKRASPARQGQESPQAIAVIRRSAAVITPMATDRDRVQEWRQILRSVHEQFLAEPAQACSEQLGDGHLEPSLAPA
jgi:hypothetical protein